MTMKYMCNNMQQGLHLLMKEFKSPMIQRKKQALVLKGDFNHPEIRCEDHTARQVQSRRFLQSIDDNFLMQVVEEPTRKGTLLDLVLTNKEGLVEDVKVGGRLSCSGRVQDPAWRKQGDKQDQNLGPQEG